MQSTQLKPPTKVSRQRLNSVALAFMLVIFMTGFAGALRVPALSVYLHNEVTPDPFMVGVFYSVNSTVSMILSQIVAHYSDKYPNRKQIILLSCAMQVASCLLFAFNRDYYLLLTLGTLITGLGGAASSQLFALSREYSDNLRYDSTMFNSILRAQLSLAWIVGPPLAYSLSEQFGFTFMYSLAAGVFVISMIVVAIMLPQAVGNGKKSANPRTIHLNEQGSNRLSVVLLALACLMVWTCNSMMFINMPIYLTQELKLPEQLTGVLMGTAAGLEIPVMLLAGYCTRFFTKKAMMTVAILAALLYYLGVAFWAKTEWQLIGLQLFNGIFVGILASIGMVYFQDLMPNKMGTATTLFNNTGSASWIIAGPLAGLMAKYFDYRSTWLLAVGLCSISLIAILPVKKRV